MLRNVTHGIPCGKHDLMIIVRICCLQMYNVTQQQVEVEVRLAESNSTVGVTGPSGEPRSENILKRSTETMLAADVYILPTGLSEGEIHDVKQVGTIWGIWFLVPSVPVLWALLKCEDSWGFLGI